MYKRVVWALIFAASFTLWGCGGDESDETVKIGVLHSLSGTMAISETSLRDVVLMAVEEINAAGGVKVGGKMYKLKIKYYDDESTPLRTAQLGERLIKQDGIKFLLGPYSSATTKAMQYL